MSAKLLYSLSGKNSNQQKQFGCMNGFLQFFDPHHFIGSRSANNSNRKILLPDENRRQGGEANGATKKTKGKHPKVIKTQGNSSESSRISVSSSSAASTIMSSVDCEWSVKNEQFPSPIKTAPREQAVRHAKKHVDSPRLLQPPKHDGPRHVARNDSFRSTNSNQSAPILPLRKKYPDEAVEGSPRFSHESREVRDTYISSLQLRDLPRLSLDSRQRIIKKSPRESKDDLVLRHLRRDPQNPRNAQNLTEEPASYRPPSNVVAKLMGLEALPDCSLSIKTQIEQDDSSICGSSDFLSRSPRTITESRVKGGPNSPRNNSSESKPRARKDRLLVSKNQELSPEPQKHTLTVYANIEKRMNDLDFKRSGKDLRALKRILESIHREKTKLLSRNENRCSDSEFETCSNSSTYVSQNQGLREAASQHQDRIDHIPLTGNKPRPTKNTKSRDTKPCKLVKDSKQEAAIAMQDLPLKSLHQIKIGKPGNGTKDAAQKKSIEHTTLMANHFHDPSHQTPCTARNKSGERTPRPKAVLKGQPMTKANVPCPVKTSKTVSSNIFSHIPATTIGSKMRQHKPNTKGLRSQSGNLQQKSYILKDKDNHSEVIRTNSTFLSHEKNKSTKFLESMSEMVSQKHTVLTSTDQLGIKYDTWQIATNNKNADAISGDTSLKELAITVREQPSPVSVLDTNFYGDESPSPIKKKPTAFRDYETNASYRETEWSDIDGNYSPNSPRPSFSYEKEDTKVDNFSQTVQALRQVDYSPKRSTESVESQEEVNLEKADASEILVASGILDDISFNAVDFQVEQSQVVDPKLFLVLEQTQGSRYLSENRYRSKEETIMGANERRRRKLLFDMVNEILSQKLSFTSMGSRTQFLKKILAPATDSQQVLQEICTEINQLQANSSHQSLHDENDFLIAIIEKDLAQVTGNWGDVSSEIPGLVLDIERLIFKDLVVELVI